MVDVILAHLSNGTARKKESHKAHGGITIDYSMAERLGVVVECGKGFGGNCGENRVMGEAKTPGEPRGHGPRTDAESCQKREEEKENVQWVVRIHGHT